MLGNLSAAAYGLDQTIEQLNDFLIREEEMGWLGHDRDEPIAPVLQDYGEALAAARELTGGLHAALSEAQSTINAIHGTDRPRREPGARTAAETAAEDFPIPVEDSSLLHPGPDRVPSQGASALRPIRKEG